jgi:uncharacterized membrane protein YhaH (DUF805 family)
MRFGDLRLKELLFGLDGRIGRAQFWLGTILIAAVSIAATYAIIAFIGVSRAAVAFSAAVAFALAYPSYAVMAKRFQDRNRPGWFALIALVPTYAVNLLYTFEIFDSLEPSGLAQGADVIISLIFLSFLVVLGFLKGTQGPNSYGPDPLGQNVADAKLG